MGSKIIFTVILLAIAVPMVVSTLSRKSPKSKDKESKTKSDKPLVGPQDFRVLSNKLVNEYPTTKEILARYRAFYKEVDEHRLEGMVLGYVTPWNNRGYDIAKIFGNKFSHISPVWLQIRRTGKEKYEITGTHDVDIHWMTNVRNAGRERNLKIVPRVLFEAWTGQDYSSLLTSRAERNALVETFVDTAKEYTFDGYVIEVWTQLVQVLKFDILVNFIKELSDGLTIENLEVILVVPPMRGEEELFTNKHFEALYEYVTAFSLMTYDFSNPSKPGPNAPLPWVRDCIISLTSDEKKRKKILTGLNFYGNDYSTSGGGGPIVSDEYIKKLKLLNGRLMLDSGLAEHYFQYETDEDTHVVFYPTLYSIYRRLELTETLNTGVSIWELGQGLDYFYDLL